MIKIEYGDGGYAIRDCACLTVAENIAIEAKADIDKNYYFATENVFAAIRLLIAKGEIDHTKIVFVFADQELKPNKYGVILDWPNGFCDTVANLSEEILRNSLRRKKEDRENGNTASNSN